MDYGEKFACVVEFTSVQALCSKAPEDVLELDEMEVTSAFLNENIDGSIYMEVPEGVVFTKGDIVNLGFNDDVKID